MGGLGNDVYLFGRGGGHDIIEEKAVVGSARRNVVRLGAGIAVDDIELLVEPNKTSTNYNDLIIRIKDTGETLTIRYGLHTGTTNINNIYSIQAIEFADGTVWEWKDILKQPMRLTEGTVSNRAIFDGACITGNASNDTLNGGAGNDTFLFGRGDGHDTIFEYSEPNVERRNVIRLGDGIGVDDIELSIKTEGHYTHLIVCIKDTGETLTVKYAWYNYSLTTNFQNRYSIQAIEFADGTVWEWDDICRQPLHLADGSTTGPVTNDAMFMVGNDLGNTLTGGARNDIIHGGKGNDIIKGGSGDDILWGGAGNDYLEGGAGNDTYLFGRGDGHDTILEYDNPNVERRNVIRLGDGIGVDDIELLFKPVGNSYTNLIIRIKDTGETLTIQQAWYNYSLTTNFQNRHSIQAIEFADGTVWEWDDICRQPLHLADGSTANLVAYDGLFMVGNDLGNTLTGGSGNDTIHGGKGNDIIYGGYGDDILWGGAGNDSLEGGDGNDTLRGGAGNDILGGGAGDDVLWGDEGDDKLYGGAGNDILWGGAGDDRLEGGAGDDVYMFGRGDGHDVIYESETRADRRNVVRLGDGIGVNDIELLNNFSGTYDYTDLIIRIKSTGETLTIKNGISNLKSTIANAYSIQAIEFADGTVWEWDDILRQPMRMADDAANCSAAHEGSIVIGNSGNNSIWGWNDNDILHGGAGDDKLYGGAGNDILWGGAGNDRLEGGAGDDVYMFGRGDGHDVVYEDETRAGRRNVIRLGDGIGADDIELLVKYAGSAQDGYNDFIVRIKDTGETITVKAGAADWRCTWQDNRYAIQGIEFADGTVWGIEDILRQPLHSVEGEAFAGAPKNGGWLVGTSGSDALYGRDGNDILHGGAGDDKLYGGTGNDVLWGGAGNDRLEGGAGDDVYVFGRGDGHDVVYEDEARAGRRNVIRLGDGIGADDIELLVKYAGSAQDGYNDFIIRIKDTGETITVKAGAADWRCTWQDNRYAVQAIEFADGTVWEAEDILRQPLHSVEGEAFVGAPKNGGWLVGTSGVDAIYGRDGNDILHGGAGDDKLYGAAGNDILWGGAGNDYLEGGAGNDTYLFNRGDGQDSIYDTAGDDSLFFGDGIGATDLWFSRSGNHLIIDVLGTEDKVTIQNWYNNAAYKVETIAAGDMTLTHTQMDQLIQAMASFGVPQGVDGHWTDEQKETLTPVLSSYWRRD